MLDVFYLTFCFQIFVIFGPAAALQRIKELLQLQRQKNNACCKQLTTFHVVTHTLETNTDKKV